MAAVDNGLRGKKAFKFWVRHATNKTGLSRWPRDASMQEEYYKYKYGIEAPTTYAGAFLALAKLDNWKHLLASRN